VTAATLDRRQLFGLAAVAGPTAARPEKNIRWGLGAVTWVRQPGDRPVRWADVLADTAAAGFEGVEPYTTARLPVDDANVAELEALAPRRELAVSGIYWSDRLRRRADQLFGYLARLGSDRLLVGPPPAAADDERPRLDQMARALEMIGRAGWERHGVKVGVHPHVGGLVENPRQIDRLMAAADPRYVHLAPDTAQIWMGGGDPVAVIGRYVRRVCYVHYKDVCGYHRGLPEYADRMVGLGAGVIDLPAVHRVLKDAGYRGWVVIDQDHTGGRTPLETGRRNRAYIDRVLTPLYR
jgi:inosose dehydratase